MRAWEIRNGTLALHDVELPHPNSGETLVRVSYTGLCGSDLPKLLRPNDFALPQPWRPGHEIVGTDIAGRPVAVDPLVSCGQCDRCAEGDIHLCPDLQRLGWDLSGGYAEYTAAPTANARPLPPGLDLLHATLADPTAVAIHGLRCNPIGSPGRLAVVGAGTVGLLTALYASWQGWEVTVLHRDGCPPDQTIAATAPITFHCPSTLPKNETFDLVVDTATGADSTPLELALRLVRDGGVVVVQNAYHPGVALLTPLRNLFRRSIHLIGSFSYCRRQRLDDFALALQLLHDHAAQIVDLVNEAGQLADLPTIIRGPFTRSGRTVLAVHHS